MKKLLILLGIILMTANNAFGAAAMPPQPDMYRLANGLTVMIQEDDRFPLVSMRLYVHAGSAYETPKEAGLSHLLEHMVFQGTDKRSTGDIAKDIEALGGYLNAATSFDYTVYITDLPSEHWRTGLDVLKDMAFHAKIGEKELESEKKVVIAELKRGEDNPRSLVFQQLQASALAKTPYERPIIGYENVLNSITRQDILDYIGRLYQPQSMLLLVAGKVDQKKLRLEIEKEFGSIPNKAGYVMPESIAPQTLGGSGPLVTVQKGQWNKIYLGLAFPTIGQRDARSVHLDVLANLLGGGKTSYLYRKYKYEKQLVDSISLSNYSFERLGMLYFTAVLDEDKFEPFWREFSKELPALGKVAFTQEELDRVKLNSEDELFRAKETLSGLTNKLGYFTFFDQGEQGEENYLYTLRQTSLADLAGQLDEFMRPEKLSVTALLPEKASKNITEAAIKKPLAAAWPKNAALAAQAEQEQPGKKTETINLGKGRTLILIPDNTLPYVSGSLLLSGGDALLDKDVEGLAALTAATLTKGAGKLGATEIEDYLADRAASLGAGSGRQSFSFSFTCPTRFNADIFALLADTMQTPAFKTEEFERARQNQISAIRSTEDQPLGLAFRRIFPFLFPQHSYGFMQLGTAEGVAAFKVEQAKAFWDIQKQQAWVLSICGSFDREAVIAAAKKLPVPSFGTPISIAAPEWSKEKELNLRLPGRNQSHILLVFPTAPLGDKDEAGLNLLQSVLSGMSGLLFTELRDKQGLGYTVTAMPWNAQKAGMLIFYIGTEPDKVEQAKKGFLDVVRETRNAPLPNDLLERGKNTIRGEYYRGMQSLGARSGEASTLFILGRPLDATQKQIEATAKITPEELQKIAQKYLDMSKAYWVEVQP